MREGYKRVCSTTNRVHVMYADDGVTLCGSKVHIPTRKIRGQKRWLTEGYENEPVTCKSCFRTYGFVPGED